MKTLIQKYLDQELDYDEIVKLMDDEIREDLHNKYCICTREFFIEQYEKAHFKKFGQEFIVN